MGDITRWEQSESPSLKEHDVPDIELKDDGKCHVVSDEGQLFPDSHYQTDIFTSSFHQKQLHLLSSPHREQKNLRKRAHYIPRYGLISLEV